FALCLTHPGPRPLVHLDLYRLGDPGALGDAEDPGLGGAGAAAEALGLGSGELVGDDRVVIVEWADRWISPPEDRLEITIDRPRGSLTRRHLEARATGPRAADLLDRWVAVVGSNTP
ncbi:MAG: tRNA (adenosine(37)-N6)-threonylcarbamoyltransferase complex ATPase subunit type 1 TsaE, partial [Myxococcales bacterium]|nr:tRNA (adenosine(37)-N6)-threonylcarbamoyltransferase complex ATPase subunit type 1 TsaE [Myxococcales bacterium]